MPTYQRRCNGNGVTISSTGTYGVKGKGKYSKYTFYINQRASDGKRNFNYTCNGDEIIVDDPSQLTYDTLLKQYKKDQLRFFRPSDSTSNYDDPKTDDVLIPSVNGAKEYLGINSLKTLIPIDEEGRKNATAKIDLRSLTSILGLRQATLVGGVKKSYTAIDLLAANKREVEAFKGSTVLNPSVTDKQYYVYETEVNKSISWTKLAKSYVSNYSSLLTYVTGPIKLVTTDLFNSIEKATTHVVKLPYQTNKYNYYKISVYITKIVNGEPVQDLTVNDYNKVKETLSNPNESYSINSVGYVMPGSLNVIIGSIKFFSKTVVVRSVYSAPATAVSISLDCSPILKELKALS